MKRHLLFLSMLFMAFFAKGQYNVWKEFDPAYDFRNHRERTDDLHQRRLWADDRDHIFMINYTKKNILDILKVDQNKIVLAERTANIIFNEEFHFVVADGFGGFYYCTDKINNTLNIATTAIYHVHHGIRNEIASFSDNNFVHQMYADGRGNLYVLYVPDNNHALKGYLKKWDGTRWSRIDFTWDVSDLYMNSYFVNKTNDFRIKMCSDEKGNLIVSGNFYASGVRHRLAVYKMDYWQDLGSMDEAYYPYGKIYAMKCDKQGNLYVSGTCADEHGKKYVAKWNGQEWNSVGTGASALNANDNIYTIALDSAGNVYAAGNFRNKEHHRYVAKWDGSSWAEVGSNKNTLKANGTINSIYVDSKGVVFATGEFTNKKGNRYLAYYNQKVNYEPEKRTVKVADTIQVSAAKISISVWDNESVDGDVLYLQLKDTTILNNYTLTKNRKVITTTLQEGENKLVMVAVDEGRYQPCTAAIVIDDGVQKQTYILDSDFFSSGCLIISCKH